MDCNRVFDALMAGPFPSGRDSDVAVERHLIACVSCRRIAEALRPDDEQTHESLTAMERAALPRYRGANRPVKAMTSAAHYGVGVAADRPDATASGDWRQRLSVSIPHPQLASFSIAPRQRTATAVEALSMLATLAAAAAAFWGLGMLAL